MNKDNDKSFGYAPELPEDIQPIFQDLCQDMASLHHKWKLYLDLFSERDTVDLLKDIAPSFFQMVEESLRSDITMTICRLSDPRKSCGHENLSIKTLVDKATNVQGLEDMWNEFHSCCKPISEYRNKRVGHNDHDVALKKNDNPLFKIKRPIIDSILSKASILMNCVSSFYNAGQISFRSDDKGGGKDLVLWLKRARGNDQEEQRGNKRGHCAF